jgi:hypothetical protein
LLQYELPRWILTFPIIELRAKDLRAKFAAFLLLLVCTFSGREAIAATATGVPVTKARSVAGQKHANFATSQRSSK